jgi:hypothetical protein
MNEHICDDGCGRVDVRGAIEGPWPVCMNCGARVTEYVPVPDEQAIERAERRVESILRPYSSALSPEIVAEQIVAAVPPWSSPNPPNSLRPSMGRRTQCPGSTAHLAAVDSRARPRRPSPSA